MRGCSGVRGATSLSIMVMGCIIYRMEPDNEKIDQAVLALMYLTLHDGHRAWKTFDWGSTKRLHEQGFIENPIGKAKSVVFTERGLAEAERLFEKLFVSK